MADESGIRACTPEDLPCRGGRCTLNPLKLKRPPIGVMWKLGEGMPAQMTSWSLDQGSKLPRSVAKIPRVTEWLYIAAFGYVFLFYELVAVASSYDGGGTDPCQDKNGIIPNPEDCESYFICKNGTSDFIRCSDGLLFNKLKLTCDYDTSVDCDAAVSGRKIFQTCSNSHLLPASSEYILDCLGLALEDIHASPLLVLDFSRVNGPMDLI
ncbi:uncharacterized protein TNCV_2532831 [Trichonephila clavipes]|nr:uncharacterized protein TNCV_2532831 [Trichonephila clavipes]